jgi:hypothetical protein
VREAFSFQLSALSRNRSLALGARIGKRLMLFALLVVVIVGCDRRKSPEAATTSPAVSKEAVRTAEQGPVKLTVKLDRTEATIPEQLRLTVVIEAEQDVDAAMPELGGAFGEFNVAGHADAPPVETADGGVGRYVRRERAYMLDTVLPGDCAVPAVTVTYTDSREKADGSHEAVQDKVSTRPIPVTVKGGPADVKGPMWLPMPGWQRLALWTGVVVAALVAIALAARWWRRRNRPRELRHAIRVKSHEWALAELDRLVREDLIGRGRIQEFYYRVNGLVRRYIELRFGMMAGEQTSEEFIRAVQLSPVLADGHKEVLRQFERACDPVKYARQEPQRQEIDWVQTTAREFVVQTAESEELRRANSE